MHYLFPPQEVSFGDRKLRNGSIDFTYPDVFLRLPFPPKLKLLLCNYSVFFCILPERSLEIEDIAQSETISVQLHVSIK